MINALVERFRLKHDISSKVLAFAFGLSAEIERNLIYINIIIIFI